MNLEGKSFGQQFLGVFIEQNTPAVGARNTCRMEGRKAPLMPGFL